MSLTTVTLALDDKLRSLRNSSFDSDKEAEITTTVLNGSTAISTTTAVTTPIHHQPLTLGENIPYADESPERPLIQLRSKPIRISTSYQPTNRYTTRLYSHGSTSSPPNSPLGIISHSSQENVVSSSTKICNAPAVSSSSSTNKTLATDSGSSEDTDASTTSNPMETFPNTVIIDRDMLREMSRILTTLERKATKLNRSLSLNYKNHKGECCCNMNNNNNNNNNSNNNNNQIITNSGGGGGGSCYRTRLSAAAALTKDEKTDKNINKKRQIQDGKSRRYTNRSIKRRHTVGGTHDYDVAKSTQLPARCQQGHNMMVTTRTSSPDLAKDNQDKLVIISNEQ